MSECRALIPWRRELFTFTEQLILGEALKRLDLERVAMIHREAIIRSLGIPARLFHGDVSYSQATR
jgi:hypothetical protein